MNEKKNEIWDITMMMVLPSLVLDVISLFPICGNQNWICSYYTRKHCFTLAGFISILAEQSLLKTVCLEKSYMLHGHESRMYMTKISSVRIHSS